MHTAGGAATPWTTPAGAGAGGDRRAERQRLLQRDPHLTGDIEGIGAKEHRGARRGVPPPPARQDGSSRPGPVSRAQDVREEDTPPTRRGSATAAGRGTGRQRRERAAGPERERRATAPRQNGGRRTGTQTATTHPRPARRATARGAREADRPRTTTRRGARTPAHQGKKPDNGAGGAGGARGEARGEGRRAGRGGPRREAERTRAGRAEAARAETGARSRAVGKGVRRAGGVTRYAGCHTARRSVSVWVARARMDEGYTARRG